jgi:hypothetical protein
MPDTKLITYIFQCYVTYPYENTVPRLLVYPNGEPIDDRTVRAIPATLTITQTEPSEKRKAYNYSVKEFVARTAFLYLDQAKGPALKQFIIDCWRARADGSTKPIILEGQEEAASGVEDSPGKDIKETKGSSVC